MMIASLKEKRLTISLLLLVILSIAAAIVIAGNFPVAAVEKTSTVVLLTLKSDIPSRSLRCNLDLGEIDPVLSPKVSAQVLIVNDSGRVATLDHVKTDCGCLAADEKRRMIPPGETDIVEFTYDPGIYPAKVLRRAILAFKIDDAPLEATLQITGTVKPSPVLDSLPKVINAEFDSRTEVMTRTVEISRVDGSDVSVTGIDILPLNRQSHLC